MIGLQTKEEYTDREIDPNQGEAQIDEDDQPGNIAKEAKYDELQAEGKGLLLLPNAPQHHHEQGHLGGGDKEGWEEEDDHEGDEGATFRGAGSSCCFIVVNAGTFNKITTGKA